MHRGNQAKQEAGGNEIGFHSVGSDQKPEVPHIPITTGAAVNHPVQDSPGRALAFRGDLTWRSISAEFEEVRPKQYKCAAFLLSSVLVGLIHDRWVARIIEGFVYGLVVRYCGKICDAVLAHAFANALIAAGVLFMGAWWL